MEELTSLSDRELEVLKLVATGATNQQIARALVISPNTVKVHLRNIFEKLGVQSRTEATMAAVNRGWVQVNGAVMAAGEESVEELPWPELPVAPHRPIATWQRLYMLVAALLVLAAALAPDWWHGQREARRLSAFTDVGQPLLPALPRPQVARWTARAVLPEPRSRLALAATNGKLFAIGGEMPGQTGSIVSDAVGIYDPASNGWLPGARKPTGAANIAAAVIDGRIYVPGGTTVSPAGPAAPATSGAGDATAQPAGAQIAVLGETVSGVLEVYDPRTDSWESRAPLPAPRAGYGLAVLGNKLYLFAGWDGERYRAETFVYDPQADAWSQGTPMAAPRAFLGASTLNNLIYVVGGYDGRRELNTVTAYDPALEGSPGGPWSSRPGLNQPRAGLGLLSIGPWLYAIGGGWTQQLAFNEQFDVTTGAWSKIESPVLGQWRSLGIAGDNVRIYAVGGWSGGYLAVNEEYRARYEIVLPLSNPGPRPTP